MRANEIISELSTDALARYKKAAGADAKKSDAEGNYARGDKRFKGINKATNKQFDNDIKKHKEQGVAEKIDSRFRKTEWIPIADALKILKHYGATIEEWGGHFHFAYYDREGVRKRIEDLTWNADDTRNVRLSILNQAVRELKAQKQGVAEIGNNYHANTTGFAKPKRNDDERHDLDVAQSTIYGLKINGQIWKKDGHVVTFATREKALAARNSLMAKRPDLEVGLIQKGSAMESASGGATGSGSIASVAMPLGGKKKKKGLTVNLLGGPVFKR